MAPSQFKQLKASIHARRTSKNPKESLQKKPVKQPQKETPAQKANRLREETLLPEFQRRNKAGGIIDRRIGEHDESLQEEERALKRFAASQRVSGRARRKDAFNLEDPLDGEEDALTTLTHFGRPVGQLKGEQLKDDFEDNAEALSSDNDLDRPDSKKRKRLEEEVDEITNIHTNGKNGIPPVKKSRKEVMEEVIKKSKLYKHERQQAKEEDEDAREELDKGMPQLLAALKGAPISQDPSKPRPLAATKSSEVSDTNGEIMKSSWTQDADKMYDQRMKQLALEQRAQPTERSKTAEDRAKEETNRRKEREKELERRMKGEDPASGEGERSDDDRVNGMTGGPIEPDAEIHAADDAAEFGLTGPQPEPLKGDLDAEDEDEFIVDEDLVASGSEIDSDDVPDYLSQSDQDQENEISGREYSSKRQEQSKEGDDFDEEFLADVLPNGDHGTKSQSRDTPDPQAITQKAFQCPQTHDALLSIFKPYRVESQPLIVQRIRTVYHPSLAAENKTKLQHFATALVEHIYHLPTQESSQRPLPIVETIIRHIHSLSRSYPIPVAQAFRSCLSRIHQSAQSGDQDTMNPGDLTILTAISTIYPTSDHFHAVVTPAITIIARWLGTATFPASPKYPSAVHAALSRKGAYLVTLCVRYQRLSRRYIPEVLRFTEGALSESTLNFMSDGEASSLTSHHVSNIGAMMDLWRDQIAFIEIFTPGILSTLKRLAAPLKQDIQRQRQLQTSSEPIEDAEPQDTAHLVAQKAYPVYHTLKHQLHSSQHSRLPLELHHHRALPIRSSAPLIESEHASAGSSSKWHPSMHHDPDPQRAEAARLRKELKREQKGARKELKRDAEFLAREQLKSKKERDRVYEERQRKLVEGIAHEEGAEAKEYERVKARRKGKRF